MYIYSVNNDVLQIIGGYFPQGVVSSNSGMYYRLLPWNVVPYNWDAPSETLDKEGNSF